MRWLAGSYLKSSVASRALVNPSRQIAEMKAPMTSSPEDLNAAAVALIKARSILMKQQVYGFTFDPAATPVLYINPKPVGLVLGFLIECNFGITDPGAGNSYGLTDWGPANVLKQITFQDLASVTRHQTTGWHVHAVNSAKGSIPFAAARTNTRYPINFGDNFGANLAANQTNNIIQAAAIVDHTHFAQGVQMMYYLPIAYSPEDLRGAYYANVVNSNAQLQLTINPSNQAFVAGNADPNNAVYQIVGGAPTTGWSTSCTVNVYQIYYDQLPIANNGQPILPSLSMAVNYSLWNSQAPSVAVNQDFPISFANWRDFLSVLAIYDNHNSGVMPAPGSDINYWALQQANSTNIFKLPPKYVSLLARAVVGDDYPPGAYYFDSRVKPISTVQFGNQQLVLNASAVNGAAQVLLGWEFFSYQNTIQGSSSLSSGT